jgi:putative DNA primase/helicase
MHCAGRSGKRPARSKETLSMLADFQAVLDRLNVASRNGEKAMSFCPAHNDRNSPSLSLKAQDGKLLLNCFAGCRPEDIVSKIGLGMKDLFS